MRINVQISMVAPNQLSFSFLTIQHTFTIKNLLYCRNSTSSFLCPFSAGIHSCVLELSNHNVSVLISVWNTGGLFTVLHRIMKISTHEAMSVACNRATLYYMVRVFTQAWLSCPGKCWKKNNLNKLIGIITSGGTRRWFRPMLRFITKMLLCCSTSTSILSHSIFCILT